MGFEDIPTRENGNVDVEASWWNTIKEKLVEAFPTIPAGGLILDEDDFSSDSAEKVPSQQSVKVYADTKQARSTLTTKGDLYAATAAATVTRLGVGSNDQVLTADSTEPTGLAWKTPAASSGAAVSTKTTAYTLTTSDDYILADASSGAFTLTLPTSSGNTGKAFFIKKVDSTANGVTIDAAGSETIDGEATRILYGEQATIQLVSDGSNWITVTEFQEFSLLDSVLGFTLSPSITMLVKKNGPIVFLKIPALAVTYTKSGTGAVTIGTLPVGFRPSETLVFPFNSRIGGTYGFNSILINTSGLVLFYSGAGRNNIGDSTTNCGWDVSCNVSFDVN